MDSKCFQSEKNKIIITSCVTSITYMTASGAMIRNGAREKHKALCCVINAPQTQVTRTLMHEDAPGDAPVFTLRRRAPPGLRTASSGAQTPAGATNALFARRRSRERRRESMRPARI